MSTNDPQKPADWWEGFKAAVENPDVSTYEYLRDHIVKSLELDGAKDMSDVALKARKKAVKELFSLTDAKELSGKLKALEENTFLFNGTVRAGIKVGRVIIDTYVAAQAEAAKELKKTGRAARREKIEAIVSEKMAGAHMEAQIQELAKTFENKDEEEIRGTIRQAVQQMGDDKNVEKASTDFFKIAAKYMTLDNMSSIAVHILPLITWKFRWALALGLGAYESRMSVYHGARSLTALVRGKKDDAREEGGKALTALKAAGGNILIIGLSPAIARVPKIAAGFVSMAIEKSYAAVLDSLKEAIAKEEEKPGSTPLSKGLRKKLKQFFSKNADGIASNTVKAIKEIKPTHMTETMVEVSGRLPLSKLTTVFTKAVELGGALVRRFNKAAAGKKIADAVIAEEKEIRQEVEAVSAELKEVGETLKESVDAADEHIAHNHPDADMPEQMPPPVPPQQPPPAPPAA